MRSLLPLVALLSSPALAQSFLYDAGQNGSPPIAPSPETLGWVRTATGAISEVDVSPDPNFPVNAWQVTDPGPGASVRYEQPWDELPAWFEFELVYKPMGGTLVFDLDTGDGGTDSFWRLHLTQVGGDVVLDNSVGDSWVLAGLGDGAYHSILLRGWQGLLQLYVDDELTSLVSATGPGTFASGAGLRWGTSDAQAGRARIQHVALTVSNWSNVGSSICGPAVPHSGGESATLTVETFAVPVPSAPMHLSAHELPPNEFGYFLVADNSGLVQPPGSDGNLCLSGNIGRFTSQLQNSGAAGTFWIPMHTDHLPTNPPTSIQAGETWYFQAWFRDGASSNFTWGVEVGF